MLQRVISRGNQSLAIPMETAAIVKTEKDTASFLECQSFTYNFLRLQVHGESRVLATG